jgi:hypothetical protein
VYAKFEYKHCIICLELPDIADGINYLVFLIITLSLKDLLIAQQSIHNNFSSEGLVASEWRNN